MKKFNFLLVFVYFFALLFVQFCYGLSVKKIICKPAAFNLYTVFEFPYLSIINTMVTCFGTVNTVNAQKIKTNINVPVASSDLHFIWLNLTGANGLFCQMAVGYRAEATNGVDDFDATRIDGQFTLNSLIDSSDNDYVIQSRALPFSHNDVVPLSTKIPVDGIYTITVDQTLGMFSGNQAVILLDHLTSTTHNLSCSSYTFIANAGYTTKRFEIIYQNLLSADSINDQNDVLIYKNIENLILKSDKKLINEVHVFDTNGSLLLKKLNLNQNYIEIPILFSNNFFLVSTTFSDGQIISKKFSQ